ncbi:hypothetical protein [Jiella sonneratiae]|uniref:Uncharacterized protein n=1 Tax=Jiella sonneratiae TaxID=2816856 RepID=A0ABS3J0T3_9HYPH|nr:hypothetical protein [Jiella sonneratiae]MBO0903298.1 hypothetical protein [Jiella sonneratiae]
MSVDDIVAIPGRLLWNLLVLLGALSGDLVVAARAHAALAAAVLLVFLVALVLSRGSVLLVFVLGFIAVAALIGADPVAELDKRQAFAVLSMAAMLLIGLVMRRQRQMRERLEDEITAREEAVEEARRAGWTAGLKFREGEDETPRLGPPE